MLYLTLTSTERPQDVLQYLESISDWTRNDRAVLIRRDRKRKAGGVPAQLTRYLGLR
jgi:hypothetical protein